MKPQRKILIVDDQPVNRKILSRILADVYETVEAESGYEALTVLQEQGGGISAVLLDLIMPGMSGYEVLAAMSQTPELAAIPVIAVSQADKDETEAKALQLGARDFISKPYQPAVLRRRLANLIELYETNVCLGRIEHDALTGLYSKDAFCRRAAEVLASHPTGNYMILAADIEHFKLINDGFGTGEGDRLLQFLGRSLQSETERVGGLCARHSADRFVALIPGTDGVSHLTTVVENLQKQAAAYPLHRHITLKFGVYPVSDLQTPLFLMCDRAQLAAESAKRQYDRHCAFYDDSMRQRLLMEQQITDEMKTALTEGQFQIYLQPKYDLVSERIAGAETLVRWIHPKLGFLRPDMFIPLFESNGFITEMDAYVWDQTCRLIARWSREGGKYVPVSVNVSRRDIYREDLPTFLAEMVKKHGLRPSQLHLEITETAYTENPQQLISVVSRLKKLGFTIEMDDFGSGYSSLNMLSELPIDVLKLDMRLIQRESEKESDRNILSFIISLAKWMNLLVVAEGVETQSQVNLLRNLDCNYVQGYYYAKPMPAEEFTQIVLHSELTAPLSAKTEEDAGQVTLCRDGKEEILLVANGSHRDRAVLREPFQNLYTVAETDNTLAAYTFVQEHFDRIAVILLDMNTPGMETETFIEKVHSNALYGEIPVVLTGRGGEAQAFAMGAADFLPKPYCQDTVLHRVQNVTAHNTVKVLEREKRMLSRMKVLAQEAVTDQLTGLYNRTELERRMQLFFTRKKHAAFLMLDMDNFKTINDFYGHGCGDETICSVTDILRAYFPKETLLCRMGGDEFAVFIPVQMKKEEIDAQLTELLEKLAISVRDITLSCSIGVCLAPENGTSYQELYHNADMALLTAKRLGKNQYQIYDGTSELPEHILRRNMDWLLDEASDAVYVCDAGNYELLYLNESTCRLAKKSKRECLGKPCYKAIWGLDRPCGECAPLSSAMREFSERELYQKETGRCLIVREKQMDWGGREARIQYIQDGTKHAALRQQMSDLAEEQQALRALLPGALLRYDAEKRHLTFVSEKLLRFLGYTEETFSRKFGGSYDSLIRWDKGKPPASVKEGKTVRFFHIERQDGSLCPVRETAFYAQEGNGEVYALLERLPEEASLRPAGKENAKAPLERE